MVRQMFALKAALPMVNEPFYLTLSFIRSSNNYVTRFDSATLAQLNIFTVYLLIEVLAMRKLSGPKVYDLRAAEDA
jgi:hypothetical protein